MQANCTSSPSPPAFTSSGCLSTPCGGLFSLSRQPSIEQWSALRVTMTAFGVVWDVCILKDERHHYGGNRTGRQIISSFETQPPSSLIVANETVRTCLTFLLNETPERTISSRWKQLGVRFTHSSWRLKCNIRDVTVLSLSAPFPATMTRFSLSLNFTRHLSYYHITCLLAA